MMQQIVSSFLKQYADLSRPILIAVSGGTDSLALLHLMLECPLRPDIGIAHVNHGWRPESKQESLDLSALAGQYQLPFHLKELEPAVLEGNLEERCRQARLEFFKGLCRVHGYQAVMLAHHADDQAETVLKRILEGAALVHLTGMKTVSDHGGLILWRPLLGINKKKLIAFVEERGCVPANDVTNLDPRFLRGRMRTSILPWLSKEFGKEISQPLCRLGENSAELSDYFDQQTNRAAASWTRGGMGLLWEAEPFLPMPLIEIKYLIKRASLQVGLHLPYKIIDLAADFLISGVANKVFRAEHRTLVVDRKKLFILTESCSGPEEKSVSSNSPARWGSWDVHVARIIYEGQQSTGNWKEAWKGKFDVYLPEGDYRIGAGCAAGHSYDGKVLDKLWTEMKVPAFLRKEVPVVWKDDVVAYEALSGKSRPQLTKGDNAMRLTFCLC